MPENFYLERLDADVDASVRAAFYRAESLGATIVPVRVPAFVIRGFQAVEVEKGRHDDSEELVSSATA